VKGRPDNAARGSTCLNEDNNHFYCSHPASDMTAEGVDRLVETYAQSQGVGALFFCTNVKRALFDSKAWEPLWQGYDPDGPPDQPALAWLPPEHRVLRPGSARLWPHHHHLLSKHGVDQFTRWLARCRKHGIESWLTVRMNDWHENDKLASFWHSEFWRSHPDFWRRPYRYEWWTDNQYDYTRPEVRQHFLALIRELCERYDFDGIELDWVRNPQCFRPGSEQDGLTILTDFHREVKGLAGKAAKRTGHRVRVGVRLPENPETCVRMGFDAFRWIAEGLVDHVVLSQFLEAVSPDPPVELWKAVTAPAGVTLGLCFTRSPFRPFHIAHTRKGTMPVTREILRGAALAAYHRGIERTYLFNFCYWECTNPDRTTDLLQLMTELGDKDCLRELPRRHPVGYREITGPGEPEFAILPTSFLYEPGAAGRYGHNTPTFCPCIGPAPSGGQQACVVIGFARDCNPPADPCDVEVRVNGTPCSHIEDSGFPAEFPPLVGTRFAFSVPPGVLHDNRNAIECFSESRSGTIAWAEIAVR